MRIHCVIMIVAACGSLVKAEEPPAPMQPLSWKPPTRRPEFLELLKGEDFDKRFKHALSTIDAAALSKCLLPERGIRIKSVVAGSQAARLGIKPGDVIVEFNRRPVQAMADMSIPEEESHELAWISLEGGRKSSKIEPGRIGIEIAEYFRPDLEYIRGKKRDPRWEANILVATTCLLSDQELSETCLNRAVAAGYDDPLLDRMGFWLTSIEHRNTAMMDFAWRWLETDSKAALPANDFTYFALESFQYQAVQLLTEKFPDLKAQYSDRIKEAHSLLQELQPEIKSLATKAAPSIETKGFLKDDLFYRLEKKCSHDISPYLEMQDIQNMLVLQMPSGAYETVTYGPGGSSMEAEFFISAMPTDNKETGWARAVGMCFLDENAPGFKRKGIDQKTRKTREAGLADNGLIEGVLGIRVLNGYLEVVASKYRSAMAVNDITSTFDPRVPTHFRIVIHRDQGEIFVNHKRCWYGYIGGPYQKLVPSFKTTGMTVFFDRPRVCELVDPKELHAPMIRDLNKPGNGGMTRLIQSVRCNRVEQIPQLLSLGADSTLRDAEQRTAIEWAAWHDSAESVEILSGKKEVSLFVAAALGRKEKVAEMLKANPKEADAKLPCGWTPFLAAVANNHEETARLFLPFKPDLNASGPDGRTALIWAARKSLTSMAKMLIEQGADLNRADKVNFTALFYSHWLGRKEIEALLKAKGAQMTKVERPLPPPNEDF